MIITFEITDETAALLWGNHHRPANTKAQVAPAIAKLVKADIEDKASYYKRTLPSDAASDTQAFNQLPES